MRKIDLGIRYLYYRLFRKFHFFGWRVAIEENVKFLNSPRISLGNFVNIDANSMLSAIKTKLYEPTGKPIIILEDNVGIGRGTFIYAMKTVHIKKDAMIGPYSFICDYDHAYEDVTKPIFYQSFTNVNPVIIEEGAWIGVQVTICSGVTIGKNAVIGAGSVVTKDIPAFSLAVGVPAKVVKKYNFTTKIWEKIN